MTESLRHLGRSLLMAALIVFLCVSHAKALDISITPFVYGGYKHTGLTLNMSSPTLDAPIDLFIRDASCVCGSVGTSVQSGQMFGSLVLEGTAIRNVDVVTPVNEQWSSRPLPFTWPGSGFSTWDIDWTVGWFFNRSCGALAGLRYDSMTVAMGNPADGAGVPLIRPGTDATLGGDLTTKTWIPYFGVKFMGSNYSANLLYSPIMSSRVSIMQSGGGPTGPASYQLVAWDWDITGTGSFAEVALDYSAISVAGITCGAWGKGTWIRASGNAQWTGLVQGTPGPSPDNDSDVGLLTRHDLSFGISGEVKF